MIKRFWIASMLMALLTAKASANDSLCVLVSGSTLFEVYRAQMDSGRNPEIVVEIIPRFKGPILAGRFSGLGREDLDSLESFMIEASLRGYLLEKSEALPETDTLPARYGLTFKYYPDIRVSDFEKADTTALSSSYAVSSASGRAQPFRMVRSGVILFLTAQILAGRLNPRMLGAPLSYGVLRGETVVRVSKAPGNDQHSIVTAGEDTHAAGEITLMGEPRVLDVDGKKQVHFDEINVNNKSFTYQISDAGSLLVVKMLLELHGVFADKWTFETLRVEVVEELDPATGMMNRKTKDVLVPINLGDFPRSP